MDMDNGKNSLFAMHRRDQSRLFEIISGSTSFSYDDDGIFDHHRRLIFEVLGGITGTLSHSLQRAGNAIGKRQRSAVRS